MLFCYIFFFLFFTIPATHAHDYQNLQNQLIQMSSAFIASRTLHIAAKINIADHLTHGPLSVMELAMRTNTHPEALYRLLRLLASYGIFREEEDRLFSLTPLAELLVSTHPHSLQPWISYHDGNEKRWQAYGALEQSIHTNTPAFNHLFKEAYFDYLEKDYRASQEFDEGMRNLSDAENATITKSYDFSPYKTIVDLGGGKGGLLTAIMRQNPGSYGILYDLPHAIDSAQNYFRENNINERITCIGGSFFDSVPPQGNLYILKRILHDWDDSACVKILHNCAHALNSDARILIIDALVASDNTRDFAKDIDVALLVLFGGKERTYHEWKMLLNQANLDIVTVHATESLVSIIEAKLRSHP